MPEVDGPDSIAVVVRAALDAQGETIASAARASGVSRQELSYWLSGRRSLRSDKVAAVLDALDLEVRPRTAGKTRK